MTYYDKNIAMNAFTSLMKQVFSAEEVETLKHNLTQEGFFSAPASTKYHSNKPGGLFAHSFIVTKNLLSLTKHMRLAWERPESPYIVGMFHDLCKCDAYVLDMDGYKHNPNMLLPGHGEKSIIIAQRVFGTLTEEEMLCIRWHMGAFDDKENWDKYGKAIEKYPNVLWTHTADMMAARINKI